MIGVTPVPLGAIHLGGLRSAAGLGLHAAQGLLRWAVWETERALQMCPGFGQAVSSVLGPARFGGQVSWQPPASVGFGTQGTGLRLDGQGQENTAASVAGSSRGSGTHFGPEQDSTLQVLAYRFAASAVEWHRGPKGAVSLTASRGACFGKGLLDAERFETASLARALLARAALLGASPEGAREADQGLLGAHGLVGTLS
jgi:hypothetical protein